MFGDSCTLDKLHIREKVNFVVNFVPIFVGLCVSLCGTQKQRKPLLTLGLSLSAGVVFGFSLFAYLEYCKRCFVSVQYRDAVFVLFHVSGCIDVDVGKICGVLCGGLCAEVVYFCFHGLVVLFDKFGGIEPESIAVCIEV